MWIVVYGDLLDGFSAVGPFESQDEAQEYAEVYRYWYDEKVTMELDEIDPRHVARWTSRREIASRRES